MNYGQFLNMMPEALLVLWLLIVFVADFSLMKSERKVSVLGKLTATLLLCQTILMFGIQPSEAFGGLYAFENRFKKFGDRRQNEPFCPYDAAVFAKRNETLRPFK